MVNMEVCQHGNGTRVQGGDGIRIHVFPLYNSYQLRSGYFTVDSNSSLCD